MQVIEPHLCIGSYKRSSSRRGDGTGSCYYRLGSGRCLHIWGYEFYTKNKFSRCPGHCDDYTKTTSIVLIKITKKIKYLIRKHNNKYSNSCNLYTQNLCIY